MKRFVSYLYSIYNNQKIHNAGFARIEIRTGRNRIEIHLKDVGYAGKTGTVYLFVRNENNIQGISIGNIIFRGNQADLRYEQPDEIIGQTSWTIMQMNGIIVTIDEKVAFLSQWDEIPVDTEKFEIWEQPDEDNRENKVEQQQNSQKESQMKGIKQDRENNQADGSNQNQGTTQINVDVQNQKDTQTYESVQSQKGTQAYEGVQSQKGIQINENNQGKRNTQKNEKNQIRATNQKNEREQNQKNIRTNENNQSQGNIQINHNNQSQENRMYELQGTSQANTEEGNQETPPEQLEQCEQTSPPSVQTAELQPQLQPGSQGWEQTWRYMLRAFPVIRQFDEKDDVLCIRIEIKDVRLLPDKYWSIVNNSFLLHGFFNYRYLAFGRIGQNWFIGVPGVYQNQEHAMASIFGFPDFLAQQKKNERGEQPGYWYRILELNQL